MPGRVLTQMFNGPAGSLLFVRIYCTIVALATGLGIVVLLGGAERFSSPGLSGPRDLVGWIPGMEPYGVWGLIFLGYGVLLLLHLGRSAAVHTLRLGMILYVFFAMSLAKSVIDSPITAATGVVVYTFCMMLHAYLADYLHNHGWE